MGTRNRDLARLVRRPIDTSAKPRQGHLASTPAAGAHAAYHRTCGHTIAVHADRQTLIAMVQGLRGSGRFAIRIRIATVDDIQDAARGLTCNLCRALT